MKIALIGTRGVPAKYGGFETCAEELGRRLVDRGHDVTVYCRTSYYNQRPSHYLGMRLVYLPNITAKAFDTLSHTLLSVLHAAGCAYDVLMVFNAGNSPVLMIPRILGKKIAVNPDGQEWRRGKWGSLGRRYYKFSEWLTTKLAHRVVADSPAIQDYYRHTYGIDSSYIAYGADVTVSRKPELLRSLGLKPREYFLQITRFEPENNPLLTLRAFRQTRSRKPLVLVGGVPYRSDYAEGIKAEAGENVLLPGFIYDKELINELWCNCYAYIHGNEVGGTNPALLQSMASGCFTIAIDVPFSRHVLSDCGMYFEKSIPALAKKIQWTLDHPEALPLYRTKAVARIRENYSWDDVTERYEAVFADLSPAGPSALGRRRERIGA